ncbi:MAG: class I SAM-dependent methyltransferase [Solirubrobacteraceae bacterium]
MTYRVDAAALRWSRHKPRWLGAAVAYRIERLARRVLGTKRVLTLLLDAAWVTQRLASENAGRLWGERFANDVLALNSKLLKDWLPEDAVVVDLGCGVGRTVRMAAPHARQVIGIDRDADAIAEARAQHVPSNARFEVGDLEDGVSSDLDVALLIHVLSQIDDADQLLQRLRLVVSMLIVEVPDFASDPLNLPRLWLARRSYGENEMVQMYTCEVLGATLQRNGWLIKHSVTSGGALAVCAIASNEVAPAC